MRPCRLPSRRALPLGVAMLVAAPPLAAQETRPRREPTREPTRESRRIGGTASRDLRAAAAVPGPFDGPSPWPAIRRARIARLLPAAMRAAGVDAWVVLLRENANDPLALHVGGENAGAPSAVLVFRVAGANGEDAVRSVMLAGFGEAIALRELALHDSVVVTEGGVAGLERAIAERLAAADPARIAVNSGGTSGGSGMADGLSWTQRTGLERALGPALAARLVPAEPMVRAWLAVKLPEEIAIMRRAAALTVRLEEEAYATIVPGVTRDHDLATFLKRRMRALGVEDGWSPAQNPSVNSGPDRGHSHASDRVIQPGDVIQTDFGIKVHGVWVTDIQRFAYVLRPGERAAPPEVERRWRHAVAGGRAAFAAMRPGVTGAQVDSAQRLTMAAAGSLPVPWGTGHAVGYWAHDAGPGLNRRETQTLGVGHVVAFDGFHAWAFDPQAGGGATAAPAWGAGTKTISVEEMAVVTRDGRRVPRAAAGAADPRARARPGTHGTLNGTVVGHVVEHVIGGPPAGAPRPRRRTVRRPAGYGPPAGRAPRALRAPPAPRAPASATGASATGAAATRTSGRTGGGAPNPPRRVGGHDGVRRRLDDRRRQQVLAVAGAVA
jgi:Xaa-Pro aminopeptidase